MLFFEKSSQKAVELANFRPEKASSSDQNILRDITRKSWLILPKLSYSFLLKAMGQAGHVAKIIC